MPDSSVKMTRVRKLARRLVPAPIKHWVRNELTPAPRAPTPREMEIAAVVADLRSKVPIHTPPTFAGDDLVSWHNPEFLVDPAFIRAVEAGNARNSWDLSRDVRWRYHVILWAARRAARLEGDFVECGVNRGGFSRAVVEDLDFARLDKTFYLMDTFNGLADEYISPAERAKGVSREAYAKYGDSYEDVRASFRPFPNVVLVRGPIPDTLPRVVPDKVCYLSIDMNVVIPEIAAATHFWERLVPGAVMILDDYGHRPYVEQKHAFDAFAAARSVEVLMLPTGQGLVFKPGT